MNRICYNCFNNYDDVYELCPHCGEIPANYIPEPFQLAPGSLLANRYVLGKAIGMGGFGVTYKAWDRQMDTVVAIKEYYPGGLVNRAPGTKAVILPEGKRKLAFQYGFDNFIEEARSMVRFSSHKNIVNVFEYFEENNTAYLVMEYLDGMDVNDYMRRSGFKLSCEASVNIVLCVINALKEVHKNGIIHRDIAPDNIKICRNGKIKLFDFGAARFENNDKKTKILKPGFAPPEQYDSLSNQGPWTDIYALGATLYYMLTGITPDESTNRKVVDELVEPRKINPEIPEYLSITVMKAMALEVHLRFQNVEEFEAALRHEKKVTSLVKEKKRKKRKRFIGLSVATFVVLIVAGIFAVRYKIQNDYATLPEAAIQVWYVKADPSQSDDDYNYVNRIAEDFENTYDNAPEIELRSFDSDEALIAQLNSSAEKPHIVICGQPLEGDVSFEEIYDSFEENKEFSDSEYGEIFRPEELSELYGNTIPLGFTVPVMYQIGGENSSNSNCISYDGLYSLPEAILIEDSAEYYSHLPLTNGQSTITLENKSALEGKTTYCFSDISQFGNIFTVATSAGFVISPENGEDTFYIYPVLSNDEKVMYSYATLYCTVYESNDEDEDRVAFRFAEYLLAKHPQSVLFSSSNYGLPINVAAIDAWKTKNSKAIRFLDTVFAENSYREETAFVKRS